MELLIEMFKLSELTNDDPEPETTTVINTDTGKNELNETEFYNTFGIEKDDLLSYYLEDGQTTFNTGVNGKSYELWLTKL